MEHDMCFYCFETFLSFDKCHDFVLPPFLLYKNMKNTVQTTGLEKSACSSQCEL